MCLDRKLLEYVLFSESNGLIFLPNSVAILALFNFGIFHIDRQLHQNKIDERGGSLVECLTQDRGFEPHQRHCVVSLSKTLYPLLSTG